MPETCILCGKFAKPEHVPYQAHTVFGGMGTERIDEVLRARGDPSLQA